MAGWEKIDESTPRDRPILCWAIGWECPVVLQWKINSNIAAMLKSDDGTELAASYFGVLGELNDYEFATPDGRPTHWLDFLPLPGLETD